MWCEEGAMALLDDFFRTQEELQRLAKLEPDEIRRQLGGDEDRIVSILGALAYGSHFVEEKVRPPTGEITVATQVVFLGGGIDEPRYPEPGEEIPGSGADGQKE
jgi:hypothetical protein